MSEDFFYFVHRGEGPAGNGVSAVDPANGQIAATISLGGVSPLDVAALPGGKELLVLVADRAELRHIDLERLAVTAAVDIDGQEQYTALALSPDGSRAYVTGRHGVEEVDAATGERLRTLAHEGAYGYRAVVVSPDGAWLYALASNAVVGFETESGKSVMASLELEVDQSVALRAAPDGSALYLSAYSPGDEAEKGFALVRVETQSLTATAEIYKTHNVPAAVAADGRVYIPTWDDVCRFNPQLSEDPAPDSLRIHPWRTACLSPDGGTLATSSGEGALLQSTQRPEDDEHEWHATFPVALPGTAVALTTAAAPAILSARLEAGPARALAAFTVSELTARLTTQGGDPITGQPLTFTSAGGLDLGTAHTAADGTAQLTAQVLLPIDPETGTIDTSALTGPYTVRYPGQSSYSPADAQADLTL
ncbi:hypothetical protein [Streptomyces subrutilus]|uniref:hypothetical protein n=1 Tax=Streptomyces subrutilus TaxID=36818 RepID=UPI0033E10182